MMPNGLNVDWQAVQEAVSFSAIAQVAILYLVIYSILKAAKGTRFGQALMGVGIIAVTAIIIRKELLIPIICFVFLIESVSVLGQNFIAKKGNRIGKKFRFVNRAPIHDAFRLKPEQLTQLRNMDKIMLKWPKSSFHENKVTARFWILTIILASFAIMTLKIR